MSKLSLDESGNYPEINTRSKMIKHFRENNSKIIEFDSIESVGKFLKDNLDFQVYTELHHSEKYYPLYLDRGFHAVNKTNRYVCVKDSRYTVMKYTGLDN